MTVAAMIKYPGFDTYKLCFVDVTLITYDYTARCLMMIDSNKKVLGSSPDKPVPAKYSDEMSNCLAVNGFMNLTEFNFDVLKEGGRI